MAVGTMGTQPAALQLAPAVAVASSGNPCTPQRQPGTAEPLATQKGATVKTLLDAMEMSMSDAAVPAGSAVALHAAAASSVEEKLANVTEARRTRGVAPAHVAFRRLQPSGAVASSTE